MAYSSARGLLVVLAVGAIAVLAPQGRAFGADTPSIWESEQAKVADAAAASKIKDLAFDPGTPVLGNPQGDVAVIEFFDYQCAYCKAAEPRLHKLIMDDPRVKLVVKDFPILGPESVVAAKAALASVKQGKHAAFHTAMMAHRGQLKNDTIFKIAAAVGLDIAKLRQDMDAPDVADQIIANFNLARALRLVVTPAFIVNTHVLSGLTPKTETSKIDFPAEVAAARKR